MTMIATAARYSVLTWMAVLKFMACMVLMVHVHGQDTFQPQQTLVTSTSSLAHRRRQRHLLTIQDTGTLFQNDWFQHVHNSTAFANGTTWFIEEKFRMTLLMMGQEEMNVTQVNILEDILASITGHFVSPNHTSMVDTTCRVIQQNI